MKERRDEFQLSRRDAKFSLSRATTDDTKEGQREDELPPLPPRRVKFPSNKYQTARWFYNSLIVLFLALMGLLFMLGRWMYYGNAE
jgi:hypothetical protein